MKSLKGIDSLPICLLVALFASACSSNMHPSPAVITDGKGAKYYVCEGYVLEVVDKGRRGYLEVIRLIQSNPPPDVLAVSLHALAIFANAYEQMGGPVSISRSTEIKAIVHTLLVSPRLSDRQVAVTAIYYDFNFFDEQTEHLLEKLQSDEDPYSVKFAQLSLNRIHTYPIVKR